MGDAEMIRTSGIKKCLLDKNQNFPGVFGWAISTVLALMIPLQIF